MTNTHKSESATLTPPVADTIGTCETCRFYFPSSSCGQCRRYALQPGVYPMDERGDVNGPDWPPTLADDWCGEYREQQEKGTTP